MGQILVRTVKKRKHHRGNACSIKNRYQVVSQLYLRKGRNKVRKRETEIRGCDYRSTISEHGGDIQVSEYIYKKVDYYSMRQLSDVIDELRSRYRIIGYRAYAQEQYAILTLYPIEQEKTE